MSNMDFSGAMSLSAITPLDLSSAQGAGVSEQTRIEKVSKAMESIFVHEITAEFGKGLDGKSDPMSGGGQYADFIQQALSSAVSKGGGFGLANMIEKSLTQAHMSRMAHPDLQPPTSPTDAPRTRKK